MKKFNFLCFILLLKFLGTNAHAYHPIIRSFHSVRAAGMGDVRYTTGLYEENFFANPARATANPGNRVQLPQFSFEATTNAIASLNSLLKSGSNNLSGFSDSVGKPVSGRVQLVFPAYFNSHFLADFWSFGAGFMISGQSVGQISKSGVIDPTTVIAMGPAFTLARRLLDEDRLSVGITMHTEFRATSGEIFSVLDFIKGTDVASVLRGGSGINLDFDVGTTFKPHWTYLGFSYEVGAAVNQIFDGKTNMGGRIPGWAKDPVHTPRTISFGITARRSDWNYFDSYSFSVETTDIGNNRNGSFFRTLHIGTEERLRNMAFRLGLNQGYFTCGFGLDLGFFDLNVATYGEELGLNPGTVQDRRYALEFGFKI